MNTDQSSKSTDESPATVDSKSSTVVKAEVVKAEVTKAEVNENVTSESATCDSNKAVTTKDPNAGGDIVKGAIAKELGGPKGLEPTRYGDWEKNGRCTDF